MTAQGLTYYAQDGLVKHAFLADPFTPPADIYLAAFTTFPTIGGGGTETGTREELLSHLVFAGTDTGRAETADDVTISGLTNGDTIVGLATFDASSAGNMVTFGPLTTPRLVTAGEITIPAGDFHVAFKAGTEQNWTHYLQDKAINHLFSANVAEFTEWDTFATDLWLAAFTVAPTVDGGGTEASGYTRQPTFADMEHAGMNTGRVRNANDLAFTDLPDDAYTHIALLDDDTAGDMYVFARLRPAVETVNGSLVFPAGQLILGFP